MDSDARTMALAPGHICPGSLKSVLQFINKVCFGANKFQGTMVNMVNYCIQGKFRPRFILLFSSSKALT